MTGIQKIFSAAALCVVLSVPAYAHTQLSASTPADEAQLSEAPKELSLNFSEAVRLTAVAIEYDSESHALELESEDSATEFSVALPELAPGEYVVQWRALSEDTHVITGEIRFTIAA